MKLFKKLLRIFSFTEYLKLWYILKVNNITHIFIFPFYHLGGAEKIHLQIVSNFKKANTIIIFEKKSITDQFREQFKECGFVLEGNKLFWRYNKVLTTNLLLNYMNLQTEKTVLFGANSYHFYQLLPMIKNNLVKKIDLLHAFSFPSKGVEDFSINFVSEVDVRIVINEKTILDYQNQYKANSINPQYLKRIKKITNGVTIIDKDFIKVNNKKLRIGFVGRDSAEKRLNIFYEISKILADQYDFYNVGNQTELNGVINLGEISDSAKLDQFYKETDILLNTSSREGFPLSVMEAMSNGVVCICTNVGGLSEHIADGVNGFLIENSSNEEEIVNNFVKRISELNSDRMLLKEVSGKAQTYVINNFDIQTFNEAYVKLFNE